MPTMTRRALFAAALLTTLVTFAAPPGAMTPGPAGGAEAIAILSRIGGDAEEHYDVRAAAIDGLSAHARYGRNRANAREALAALLAREEDAALRRRIEAALPHE